jgi:hypothetical protein
MTHDELIAKAREHAADFERGGTFPARVGEFARTRVRETALVYFGSNDRDDYIQILLDRENGDFISAEYSPPPGTRHKGGA